MSKTDSNDKTQSRRRFVKRATLGATLVALPVRSVWANGITNSIVASGHGSDWANNQSLMLQGPDYWKVNIPFVDSNTLFFDAFGARAIKGDADTGVIETKNDGSVKRANKDRTLSDILELKNLKKPQGGVTSLAGPNDYNRLLVAMFLNAKYGENSAFNVVYPVANGRPFPDAGAFARHLYNITRETPETSAIALAELIADPSNFSVTQ